MKHDDLITFIIEEAQHCVINDECTKSAEMALAAHSKKEKQSKPGKQKKSENHPKTLWKNMTTVDDLVILL